MAGGTWIDQNKVRPGVYINYKSAPSTLATMGERGTVAIARILDWGLQEKFYVIEDPSDCVKMGHYVTDAEMLFVRQILLGTNRTNGAKKILVWALKTTGGTAATVTVTSTFTITAKYSGAFGNRLSVVCTEKSTDHYRVETLLDNVVVDTQDVATVDSDDAITQLVANDYVTFTGTAIQTTLGSDLTGGANGTLATGAYQDFRDALANNQFDVVIYDGSDAQEKSNFSTFVKAQSNDEGSKCQLVVSDYSSADNECVISVQPQSITLIDGTVLSATDLTWWVGGASAGANVYESLTYAAHPDAASVTPMLSKSQQEAAINSGNFAFIGQFDKIQVLTDINSFHSFTINKGKAFKKNRVVRTVFGVCNDIYRAFSLNYIGAVHNDEDGRKALKAEILNILNRYQGNRALQNVVADDVTVMRGADVDSVVIEIYIQPVDSIEKIYINITIQ
jgi:hypothetical protein